ncbi:MAG: acetylglutamate kinase [Chlamydiae bacterium]|nr:MAG: acetylglutamate kinase [Chlamydiota bacterium]
MKTAIEKSNVLIEALPYIQQFKNKIVVIKYGGSTLENDSPEISVLRDVVFMAAVGMKPIIIHGGGKHISRRLEKENIKTEFVNGLRVTSKKAISIVEDVLVNEVNSWLVNKINELGYPATQLSGKTGRMIRVKKISGKNEKGENVDWGFVGEVQRINPRPIFDVLLEEKIPVIAPLGVDADGYVYNINADTVASEIASSLTAEKLVYLTDVQGIFRNIKDENSLISTIKVDEIPKLKNEEVISGGMIPKVDACLGALKNHVHKTHIINGKTPHSLLLEIFTDKGIGTEII